MELRKYRWSKAYESAEEELEQLLDALDIVAERWFAEDGKVFPMQSLALDKKLWCAEGSIVFSIGTTNISLQAGDALDIPAHTTHGALVGLAGCVCYEFPSPSNNPLDQ